MAKRRGKYFGLGMSEQRNSSPPAPVQRAAAQPLQPPLSDPNKLPTLPFYDRHPELERPRPLTARQIRRRRIREG